MRVATSGLSWCLSAACFGVVAVVSPGVAMAAGPSSPAAVAGASTPAKDGGVLVLPFAPLDPKGPESLEWQGKSVQWTLVADLSAAPFRVVSEDAPAADVPSAVAAGKRAGVRYVVLGNVAGDGSSLRLTGQVIEVATGRAVGGLKATGATRDAFRLEDAVAAQLRQYLSVRISQPDPLVAAAPAEQMAHGGINIKSGAKRRVAASAAKPAAEERPEEVADSTSRSVRLPGEVDPSEMPRYGGPIEHLPRSDDYVYDPYYRPRRRYKPVSRPEPLLPSGSHTYRPTTSGYTSTSSIGSVSK